MKMQWYVAQVVPGQEKRVKKALEENRLAAGVAPSIEEVFVPSQQVAEVKQGKHIVSERRLWPGYVLIKMALTDEAWLFVKHTQGVFGVIGEPLSEEEVACFLEGVKEAEKGVVYKHQLAPGDRVKIIDGVFVNFIGTVLEVNHERGKLGVLVTIFGRDTQVDDLEFWQVEKVAIDVGM